MKVIQIPLNPFAMNCYIYFNEKSGEGIIIDPAASSREEEERLKNLIKENKINIRFILNTHGHLDHILGNKFAKEYFKVPVLMHADDEFMLKNAVSQGTMFGLEIPQQPGVDIFISEDSSVKFDDSELRFIHTPGHSPGSVCIIDDKAKNVFCGDVIFKNSIGRTDLPGGDYDTLISSIQNKLFTNCDDDFSLFPGHMEITNIKDEKRYNPFLV